MKIYEIYHGIDKYISGQKIEFELVCTTTDKNKAIDILALMKNDDTEKIKQYSKHQVRLFGYALCKSDYDYKTFKQYDVYSYEYLKSNQQFCKYSQSYSVCQKDCFFCKGIDNETL